MSWLVVIKLVLEIATSIVAILKTRQIISGAQAEVMNEMLREIIELSVERDKLTSIYDNLPSAVRVRLRDKYKADD